jgi:hypothetical protein
LICRWFRTCANHRDMITAAAQLWLIIRALARPGGV